MWLLVVASVLYRLPLFSVTFKKVTQLLHELIKSSVHDLAYIKYYRKIHEIH